MALWGGLAAARHLIEDKLGGSVASDWSGDVRIEHLYDLSGVELFGEVNL